MKKQNNYFILWLLIIPMFLAGSATGQTSIFFEDFETTAGDGSTSIETDLTNWSNLTETGTREWYSATYSANKYAQMSSFGSGEANTTWLVTPSIDLTGYISQEFTFDVNIGYWTHDGLTVHISTDFDGTIAGSTWDDVTSNFTIPQTPTGGYGTFASAGTMDISSYSGTIHIAFKYTGDANASETTTYQVDDVSVQGTPTTPTITVTPTELPGFSYLEGNGPSGEQSFDVSGVNLTDDITISAPTNYELSLMSGGTFGGSIILVPSGGSVSTTIYTRLEAGLTAGDYNNEDITASSSGADNKTVTCSGSVTLPASLPYAEDFSSGFGDITTYNVAGTNTWEASSGYAYANGYNGDNPEEDWMILPAINLDNYSDEIMTFETQYQYGNDDADNYLKLYYSTDYSGMGDPYGSTTWNELTFTKPSTANSVTGSGEIDLSGITGTEVYIAFKYYSTDAPRAWQVDNITVEENTTLGEPTNHVASFTATANGYNQVDLSWLDNDGAQAAGGFLIKASTTSYAAIADPVDGTQEADDTDLSDGSGVVNVAHGVKAYNWTGLSGSTTYYFKIYPYTNSGVDIDYKTDGTVPQADATTDAAPTPPDLIISEVTDPGDEYNGRYVELYNVGATTIDFSNTTVYFDRQANGGNHSSIQLTGRIEPGATYTIATNASNFYTFYGFYPDLAFGSVTGNGDDGYFLYVGGDETTGLLFDAYGELDVDGTGELWEYEDSRAVRNTGITAPNSTWTDSEWTITTADIADMTPNAHVDNTTFAGTTDADWHTAANWTGGVVPTASSIVSIPTTSGVTISAAADCGSLYIKSDTSGTGSVIGTENISTKATGTVEQYLSTTTDPNWHYLSIPVGTETADAFPGYNGTYAYYWEEGWEDWTAGEITNAATALSVMTGYAVPSAGDVKAIFEGTLNDTEQSILGLTTTNGSSYEGYYLIGNPYPSPIDLMQLSYTNITEDVWFRTNGNFATYNISSGATTNGATQYAPINQGFWVKVTPGTTGDITFPVAMRTHTTHDFYKAPENNLFRMVAEKDGFTDEMAVGFYDKATNSYENFDTEKKFAESNAYPQLYSVNDGYKLAVNALNTSVEDYTVPVGLKANTAGTYTLTATNMDEFNCKANVYLRDNVTGDMIDLRKNNAYQVNITSAGDNPSRFSLIFQTETTGIEDMGGNTMKVFANNNTLFINSSVSGSAMVEVFDVTGKNVYSKNLELNKGIQQFNLNNNAGIYVVRITTGNSIISEKVVIQ